MPYLNSEPFYFGINKEKFELLTYVPSAMAQAARCGKLDTGPLPLVACLQMEEQFIPLGDLCIATAGQVHSILLFSKRPIEDLNTANIGITDETTTSVQLLRVLLKHKYHVRPHCYTTLGDGNDAFLLIGDNALREREGTPTYPYRYDLGEEWYHWTGIPFVYALWIMRRDLQPEVQELLRRELASCLENGLANLDVIAQKRRDLGLTEDEVIQYLTQFRYVAGPEEHKAIEHFRTLLKDVSNEQ